jgi:uncharacterized membrane protein YdbT with pleckstrin-like domain
VDAIEPVPFNVDKFKENTQDGENVSIYINKKQNETVGGNDMEFQERKRWLFFGLPFTFTNYTIKEDRITIDSGLLKTVENDCYMYKVQDVEHSASLIEKIFRLGTVTCFTGDTTHPKLVIEHIRHSKEIKEFILLESENARRKKRTVSMMDIGTEDFDEMEE